MIEMVKFRLFPVTLGFCVHGTGNAALFRPTGARVGQKSRESREREAQGKYGADKGAKAEAVVEKAVAAGKMRGRRAKKPKTFDSANHTQNRHPCAHKTGHTGIFRGAEICCRPASDPVKYGVWEYTPLDSNQ